MSELRKAAQMALEALKKSHPYSNSNIDLDKHSESIAALRAALAQPEPEPVAYQWLGTSVIRKRIPKGAEADAWQPLYTAPPQRKPLTDDQIDSIVRTNVTITDQNLTGAVYMAMRELEAAHGVGENK